MKLILLHGPPASGKYTIARCLEKSSGVRNFHNHLTLDVAKSLFAFGTDSFWELTDRLRLVSLEAVAASGEAVVAMTMCYSHPEDEATVRAMQEVVSASGGELFPVFLECDVVELRRRVSNPSRVEMKKLSSVEGLERCLGEWNLIPIPGRGCVTVVTGGRSAEDCAEEIRQLLGLPLSEGA